MRIPLPALIVSLLLCTVAARAEEEPVGAPPAVVEPAPATEDSGLVYLGLNDHGAEEHYRVRDGAVVIRVPGGPFLRRQYEGTVAEKEPQPVEVASLLIDKHEVTNERFARFLTTVDDAAGLVDAAVPGIERTADGGWRASPGLERHPVTAATGHGAVAYAAWVGGRLPRPAEWEKAAGGAEGNLYPWGDAAPDAARANFGLAHEDGPRGALPVGSCPTGASPYGCLDMAGNVYDRVLVRRRDGEEIPAMLKGGSWLSPHPLNLRVLDLCMQSPDVAERSVGFRCVMEDPEPDRPTRQAAAKPMLRLAQDFDAAVAEARRRRVPVFLTLLFDTCGQCDRTRAQLYTDPRFVAYCNERMVVIAGHAPGDAMDEPHPPGADDRCPLYPGLTCTEHVRLYADGIAVVKSFIVSPGNFVLHPDRIAKDAGERAVIIGERELPKWGNAVDAYIAAFERARAAMTETAAEGE